MVKKRNRWPEIGEYVVGTISRVESHGAYAILDEYNNNEGMIHISEVAASWVRNIRNFVRERQKIVAKVLNVNPHKGHIDLSLRRVTKSTKKEKVKQWKRSQKAENLLELCLEKYNGVNGTNKTLDDIYDEVGWKMEDIFGDILGGFEEAKQKGKDILIKKEIPDKWANIIAEIAGDYVEIPMVNISGTVEIQSFASDGIKQIQNALKEGINTLSENGKKINIYLIGSPKYRIELSASNYKEAEASLEKITAKIINTIQKNKGQAKFTRNK